MPSILMYQGDYVIHAPLDVCIHFLEQFPPIERQLITVYKPHYNYAIAHQYQISSNTYNYSILSYEDLLMRGYYAELDVRLEAIDDTNTQLICVSQISPTLLTKCIIVVIFSLVFAVLFSPLSLLLGVTSCIQLYLGFRASDRLIEFHHNQWLKMPT
jgi:hypothetical protein